MYPIRVADSNCKYRQLKLFQTHALRPNPITSTHRTLSFACTPTRRSPFTCNPTRRSPFDCNPTCCSPFVLPATQAYYPCSMGTRRASRGPGPRRPTNGTIFSQLRNCRSPHPHRHPNLHSYASPCSPSSSSIASVNRGPDAHPVSHTLPVQYKDHHRIPPPITTTNGVHADATVSHGRRVQ